MMARMETDYKMVFLKTVQDELFSNSQIWLLILHRCCWDSKILQEIAFCHLVRVFKVVIPLINLGRMSSIYKRFEQIHRDTAPLMFLLISMFYVR